VARLAYLTRAANLEREAMTSQVGAAILVTGAGGFIGRRVCASLARRGQRVLAVDVHFREAPIGEGLVGDLTDGEFVARLFERYSPCAVVHLASLLNRASRADPARALQVNMAASLALLAGAARLPRCRFVYASSISAYGSKPVLEHGCVDEAEPAAPGDIYGVAKRFVELAGEALAASGGLEFVALRVPIVVGPGAASGTSRWRSQIFEALRASDDVEVVLPHPPTELLPVAHVEDTAEALVALTSSPPPAHSIYNAPTENLSCGALADSVRVRNGRVSIRFGGSGVDGIPQAVNGARFAREFGFESTPLAEHLTRAAARLE
ncbi:MAG TPA: NAD(P)-dependent oxidoreductase, partial [Polyangiaceae bacterium]|nr:NAD(P)-dependent oxidoreductase [Polyangiaceae bacterium]